MGAFLKSCTSVSSEEMTRLTQLSDILKITDEENSRSKERENRSLEKKLKKQAQTQQYNKNSRKNTISEAGTGSHGSIGKRIK